MAKQLDPELLRNLRIIYGDTQLDNNILKFLQSIWQYNPQFLVNTARQKMTIPTSQQQPIKPVINNAPIQQKLQSPIASNNSTENVSTSNNSFIFPKMTLKTDGLDFENIEAVQQWLNKYGANIQVDNMYGKNTNEAINNALKNVVLTSGEKQKFLDLQNRMKGKWVGQKKSVYFDSNNPVAENNQQPAQSNQWKTLADSQNRVPDLNSDKNFWDSYNTSYVPNLNTQTDQNDSMNEVPFYLRRPQENNQIKEKPKSIQDDVPYYLKRLPEEKPVSKMQTNPNSFSYYFSNGPIGNSASTLQYYTTVQKKQNGGTMNNQEELQKAFLAFLIQDAAQQGIQLQSEQDLQAYAEQLGEEGIKAKYQEFMQKMQGGVMARLGAKLDYYKKLKGVCPDGYEMAYYKVGGRLCTTCQKKAMAQDGKKLNAVEKFKQKRKEFKKDMSKGDQASRDSIAINKWNDQETMAERGNRGKVKNGVWTPDRKKYSKKD